MRKVSAKTASSTAKRSAARNSRAKASSASARNELQRLMFRAAACRSDSGDGNDTAGAVVRYAALLQNGRIPAQIAALSCASAGVASYGRDVLGCVTEAVDRDESVAGSMAATSVAQVREIARALALAADELERLASKLGWETEGLLGKPPVVTGER